MIEQLNEPISTSLVLLQFKLLGPFLKSPPLLFHGSYLLIQVLLTRIYEGCRLPIISFLLCHTLPVSFKFKLQLVNSSSLLPHSPFKSDDNFILKLAEREFSFNLVAKMEETSPADNSQIL